MDSAEQLNDGSSILFSDLLLDLELISQFPQMQEKIDNHPLWSEEEMQYVDEKTTYREGKLAYAAGRTEPSAALDVRLYTMWLRGWNYAQWEDNSL